MGKAHLSIPSVTHPVFLVRIKLKAGLSFQDYENADSLAKTLLLVGVVSLLTSAILCRNQLATSSTSWTSSPLPITCPVTATSSTATSPPSDYSSAMCTTTTSPSGKEGLTPKCGFWSVALLIFDAGFELRWKSDFSGEKVGGIVQRQMGRNGIES